jgi:HEAT repeat protein
MLLPCLCCALLCAPDVVELKDGTRLIGEIAATKECVTIRTPLGTLEVPALDVARQMHRNDLIPRHRALVAGAGSEVRAWLTVATWDLQHGLYPEAFDSADRAAALAPGDPAVTALDDQLAREALLDDLSPADPPALEMRGRLLERVAGKSPARAAFARAALERVDGDELEAWLITQLKSGRFEARIAAAKVLGDRRSDKALAQLIRSSLLDEHSDVRAAAREGAVASHHPDLATPYLKALTTGDERMRERAYPMLETLRDPRAVPALIDVLKPRPAPAPDPSGGGGFNPPHQNIFIGEQRAYVRDFDVQIAQGAVIAKPIVGILQSGTALDVKVAGVVQITYVEQVEVVELLHRLTGQRLGNDPLAWESWWASSGGQLPPADPRGAP